MSDGNHVVVGADREKTRATIKAIARGLAVAAAFTPTDVDDKLAAKLAGMADKDWFVTLVAGLIEVVA